MFKSRQMEKLGREARGEPPPAPRREKTVRSGQRDAQGGNAAVDPLLKDAASALPLTFAETETAQDLPSERPEQDTYHALAEAAQRVFDAASSKETPDSNALIGALNGAIESLQEDDSLLTESVRQRHAGRSWAIRTANTTSLSIRLGLETGYDDRRCLALGLCSLTHDLGMLTIPAEILEGTALSDEQFQLLRNHPLESQRMVEGFGSEYSWMGKVIVQVHERYDGSGYPSGLEGDEIQDLARIIGLADMYEAMANPRADRKAVVTYNALNEIIDERNRLFDPGLIKALIRVVSIFPLGSLVKLNNGTIARVVGVNKLYPTRPLMEVLLDPQGVHLDPTDMIDLGSEPMVHIVDPAIEESVLAQ